MSKINRWLSMLLVIVMILSIVPMSAYAIDPNSGSEVGKGGSVIPTNGWSSENSSFAGIRV